MKSTLLIAFLFMLNSCSKFGTADYQSQCSDYQSDTNLKLNITNVENYSSVKYNKCSNSTKKYESKDLVNSTSNQLLLWLKDMKTIWKDFPVFKSDELSAKNNSKTQFLIGCTNDDIASMSSDLRRVKNQLEGKGVLTFEEEKSFCFTKLGIEKVNGSFVNGQLEGMATIHLKNGSLVRAPFSNGIISGLSRVFSCQYGACDFDYQPWTIPNRLSEVKTFKYYYRRLTLYLH